MRAYPCFTYVMRKLTPVHYGVIVSVIAIVLVLGYYFYVHGISLTRVEPESIVATTTEEAVFVPALAIDACGKTIPVDSACAAFVGKGRSVVIRSTKSEIRLEDPGTGKRIQSIPREPDIFNTALTLENDIDFDGYLDLEVGEGTGTLDNTLSSFWMFDRITGGFTKHPIFDGMSNLSFDGTNREVTTTSRCCAGGGFGRSVYTYLDGEYVLTYEFEHTESGGENFDTPTDTERKRVNGEMVETKTVVESWFTEE